MEIDRIIRSDRKTFSIEVSQEGIVTVRAPKRSTDRDIDAVVSKNLEWISRKKDDIARKSVHIKKKEYIDGEKFFFLGNLYELQIRDDIDYSFRFNGSAFVVNAGSLIHARKLFEQFYRLSARDIIPKRTKQFSAIIGVDVNRISITSADKRWGSCSSRRNLNFSWKLIMAPSKVIDYVIVHEISHLFELNHSPKFWAVVAQLFPEYKTYRHWLKENSNMLVY